MVLIGVVVLGMLVLAGVALLLSFRDGGLEDTVIDHGDLGLPDRALRAEDIPGLRFRVGFRGYRMQDVDAALEQIAGSLRAAPLNQAPGTTVPNATVPSGTASGATASGATAPGWTAPSATPDIDPSPTSADQ